MFSAPIFVLLAFLAKYSSAEKYAYVKLKVQVVECTDIPNEGVCPSDYKIPDYTKITGVDGKPRDSLYNKTIINNSLALVNPFFSLINGKTCTTSFRNFFCSNILPVCEDDSKFFVTNGEKTLKSCKKAEEDCKTSGPMASVIKEIINCTAITAVKQPKRSHSCQAYPNIKNNSYPCLPRNYKGPSSFPSNESVKEALDMRNMVKKYENKLDEKCVDDVAKVICDATSPACSRDEEYIVDVVSKQDCQRIMGCLNVTKDVNITKRAFEICGYLADATTAKKILLSDVYLTVNTTVSTTVNTTVNRVNTTANTTANITVNTTVNITANTTVTVTTTVVSTTKPTDKKPTQGASCVMMSFTFLYFMLFLSSIYVTSS